MSRAVVGVVLGAGRSTRMGQLKQTMPWPAPGGPRAMIAAAFDSLAPHCGRMFVTLGTEAQLVRQALGDREHEPVMCDGSEPMFEAARRALRIARERCGDVAVLLLPGDCPGVLPRTVEHLLDEGLESQGAFVAPRWNGRAGHPLLIPAGLIETVLAHDGRGGLRGIWDRRPELRRLVDVDDPACARDIDTPADYRACPG